MISTRGVQRVCELIYCIYYSWREIGAGVIRSVLIFIIY